MHPTISEVFLNIEELWMQHIHLPGTTLHARNQHWPLTSVNYRSCKLSCDVRSFSYFLTGQWQSCPWPRRPRVVGESRRGTFHRDHLILVHRRTQRLHSLLNWRTLSNRRRTVRSRVAIRGPCDYHITRNMIMRNIRDIGLAGINVCRSRKIRRHVWIWFSQVVVL
jgi:hypothetical protein